MTHLRRWDKLPRSLRSHVIRLATKGRSYRQITEELGVSMGSVSRVLAPLGGVIRSDQVRDWNGGPGRLTLEDRIEIRLGIERGWTLRQIGAKIGRHATSVMRELARNGGRDGYKPVSAHERAWQHARRTKATKLASNPELRRVVVADLERLWSPEQIAKRLRLEHGDDRDMTISHETIYKSLYVQGRGELRRELTRCLRTGRAQRKRRGRDQQAARIAEMVMISDRPAEVADRAVPGHWEGDLILGKNGKSQIGTLVERSTRFVMLLHLPRDRTAETVRDAMTRKIAQLPQALRRSITWDQGVEMAQHIQFTVEAGVPVYFCDPHSPWQRGSNENTNGLLRQYFPKGTDLSGYGEDDLHQVADSLNHRPRKTLGWKTPAETLAELVALDA